MVAPMRTTVRQLALVLAASALTPAVAQAQAIPPLTVEQGKPFIHKHTGLQFPATLGGLPRDGLHTLAEDEHDVFANYEAEGTELLSLYIYRDATNALPVWFDRATAVIEARREVYGSPRRLDRPVAFAPPRRLHAAGMMALYEPSSGLFRATGVAIVPLGPWLIKLRYSSKKLDAAGLEREMNTVLASLAWPDDMPRAASARPVQPCATAIETSDRTEAVTQDVAAISAVAGRIAAMGADRQAPGHDVVWCRDAHVVDGGAVYRADAAADGYMIAMGDNAHGIVVAPSAPRPAEGGGAWAITVAQPARYFLLAAQDRLPSPARTFEVMKSRAVVAVAVPREGRKLELSLIGQAAQ